MTTHESGQTVPTTSSPLRLGRLLPPGEPGTIAEIVEELGLWQRPAAAGNRPHVLLNMVATADGRATLAGRSGPLSTRADRELFHGLRAAVDGVLVGAGTVRTERYGRLIPDASVRRLRVERGLTEEPLACIVSGRLALDEKLPLLAEPEARVAILTASAASLPASGAQLDYIRAGHEGRLDLAAALGELGGRLGVRSLLCEGGPHLAGQLLAAGLVDELFLSVAPKLVGGEPSGGEALRIVAGAELGPPAELELLGVLQAGSYLFLRYGVGSRGRVSRETMPNSSLAS
ncbi:MAG TPA: dihydrofolate reductase family protein [Solirubrobacteraceae bacterium]|jgi:riboflavin-specific deaminase-like protein|nr:dihydrofolate reductase family protein [Solirubrobacteraceae bacterium]